MSVYGLTLTTQIPKSLGWEVAHHGHESGVENPRCVLILPIFGVKL